MSFRFKEQGKDELTILATSINSMLSAWNRLKKSYLKVKNAIKQLSKEQPDLICRNLFGWHKLHFVNIAFCTFFSEHFEEIIGSMDGSIDPGWAFKIAGRIKWQIEHQITLQFTYESQSNHTNWNALALVDLSRHIDDSSI